MAADLSHERFPPTEASPIPRRRADPLRIMFYTIGGILAAIFLAWLVLYITKGRFLKGPFERFVSAQMERKLDVAGDFQLYFNPFNVKFYAEGLTIANPDWATTRNFFESRVIDTNIATWTLLFGKDRINWLALVEGDVNLEWDKPGKRNSWTFGDPDKPAEALDIPIIRQAIVRGTEIHYRDPPMQLSADIRIETVRAADTRFQNDIRFTGGGAMRDRPFTLSGNLMSPNETIEGGRNQLRLAARSGPTSMTVSGTLPGATEIEGADLKMGVRGPNISLLFDFLGVAVPDTRAYRITSNLTKQSDSWRFTRLKGVFGESDIAGLMTISRPEARLKIDADLQTRVLDIVDAGPFIGYDPDRLEARGNAGAVKAVAGRPRVLPDARLRIDAISRFDADVKWSVRRVRAESFPVSNIALTLDLDRSLLTLSPFSFDIAGGHLDSDIAINARGTPVRTRYDIRLAPTPMGQLLARFGVEQSGTTGMLKARVAMTGEGDSIHKSLASSDGRIAIIMPRGTLWTRNVQLSELDIGTFVTKMFEKKLKEPVQINCGLIGFTVRDGVAAADPILIDTRKNVILGRGGFSFKNESIDMAVRADGKKFSLFSGQSPVGVGGYFAQPKLDVITPELVGRAGVGLGLAALASPLAAVIAFVDVGDAKAADCGPVLTGARALSQRTRGGAARDDVGRGTTSKEESGKLTKKAEKKQRKKFLGIF
ncbi:AsmA family protein [Sphingomonas cavernae]|uniref:AsmA family protein n=1 Tax=Sphingomonas cavernae TaxID=2320861 RepID=A0A418WR91_9SPHN|nr:AsmA family protein [Sphingomonas cavernae]RJF93765.1 AsmA family protein [Sphingomonas cavernae]